MPCRAPCAFQSSLEFPVRRTFGVRWCPGPIFIVVAQWIASRPSMCALWGLDRLSRRMAYRHDAKRIFGLGDGGSRWARANTRKPCGRNHGLANMHLLPMIGACLQHRRRRGTTLASSAFLLIVQETPA